MEASPELRDIIAGWFQAVSTGDSSWLDRHVSHQEGVRLVGTDPAEWLAGEEVVGFMKQETEALAGGITIAVDDVEAYREGTVGWGMARPTMTFADGAQFSPRWSAVFHLEDDDWKLVQVHASVGIPNEEVIGQDIFG
jgi:hypothetical protein